MRIDQNILLEVAAFLQTKIVCKKLREVEHNLSTIFRENKQKVDKVREHDDKFGKNKKVWKLILNVGIKKIYQELY